MNDIWVYLWIFERKINRKTSIWCWSLSPEVTHLPWVSDAVGWDTVGTQSEQKCLLVYASLQLLNLKYIKPKIFTFLKCGSKVEFFKQMGSWRASQMVAGVTLARRERTTAALKYSISMSIDNWSCCRSSEIGSVWMMSCP